MAGDVWIIGDSIIRRAAQHFDSGPIVRWNRCGGARYSDIHQLLDKLNARWLPPSLLIVHVGTNDLVDTDAFCLRQRIALLMQECRNRFPDAALVWSNMRPRACYFGAFDPKKMEMKRRSINRYATSFSRRIGATVLQHPQFHWSNITLFRFDGIHLSQVGNELFRGNLRACINLHS